MAFLLAGGRGGFLDGSSSTALDLTSGGTIGGNVTVSGTLTVTGAVTAQAAVSLNSVSGTTTVAGATAMNADLTMGSGKAVILDPGLVTAPSLRFSNATQTGWYSPGADQIRTARSGASTWRIDSSGVTADADITMASGKILTVDAGTSSAPAVRFTGSATNTGFYASTADQIQVARSGSSQIRLTAGSGPSSDGVFTFSSSASLLAALRVDAETIKTADYTVTASDVIVIMNDSGGAALTATLPPTPSTDQMLWVKNRGTSNLTVARNGNTIDGAAANLTLAAGAQATLYFEPSGWIRLGA